MKLRFEIDVDTDAKPNMLDKQTEIDLQEAISESIANVLTASNEDGEEIEFTVNEIEFLSFADQMVYENEEQFHVTDKNCLFCKYQEGKISNMELRLALDIYDEKERKLMCAECGKEVKL